ncbi:MAG: SurA N-terminal domain-containing protein [Candidatus Omnitrophica bacterium]|jgi:hypothetical protein|nr:SurA N-terminal domain-containing protein [Candidatus Omnitrophota bacterium]
MNRVKFLLLSIIILLSINCAQKEEAVVSIGDIKITKAEFERDFAKFNLSKPDTKAARKEFLDNLINRKLILKEAETRGLDKEESFLEDVQDFWEQSLLKIAVDKKARELFLTIKIDDAEIMDFYNKNKDKFSGKTLEDAYPEIRLVLFKERQRKSVEDWMESLKTKATIKVNYKTLGINE